MSIQYSGSKGHFVLFLPGDLGLIGFNTRFFVSVDQGVDEIRVSTMLDEGSSQDLVAARLFPLVELPEPIPLVRHELRLDLVGSTSLCQTLKRDIAGGDDPVEVLVRREGEDVPPYRYLANYQLASWAVVETPMASPEWLEKAAKEPTPVDE